MVTIKNEKWKLDPNSLSGVLEWKLPNGSVRKWTSSGDIGLPSTLQYNQNKEAATLTFQELPLQYMPLSYPTEQDEDWPISGNDEFNIITPEMALSTPLAQDAFQAPQNSLRADAPPFVLPGSDTN